MDRETLDENKRSGGVLRISCLDFKEMDNPSRIYPCTSIGFLVIAGLGSRHQESANRATVVPVRRERRLDSSGWNSRPGTASSILLIVTVVSIVYLTGNILVKTMASFELSRGDPPLARFDRWSFYCARCSACADQPSGEIGSSISASRSRRS
jgi:hypothetical protein